MSPTAADWLERGRQHQWHGRPVDAMLCFRRAAREAPPAMEPRFHLGEVLWQLGRLPDAIACWREAVQIAPDHPAAQMALAEALLGTGDARGATAVAARRLEHHPRDARAQAIAAIALLPVDPQAAVETLLESLRRMPELVGVTSIAGTLARVLDGVDAKLAAPIHDEIAAQDVAAARVAAMPADLLAQVMERTAAVASPRRAAWLAAVLARPWTVAEHDAVRRIAVAAAAFDARASAELAAHYAALCERAERGVPPLAWPRRTSGAALRVVVVTAARRPAQEALARLQALPRARFAVVVATLGAKAAQVTVPCLALPGTPTMQDAKRVATLDADVLVDLSGLAARAGPLLAQRPARLRLTLAELPLSHVAPLVEHAVADVDALIGALEAMQSALPPPTAGGSDAAALSTLWIDAVAHHQAGDHAGARAGYSAVLAAQPGYAPTHFLLGRLLSDTGAPGEARGAYATALALCPDYIEARVAAIRAAIDAGDAIAADALAKEGASNSGDPPAGLLRALGAARLAASDGDGAAALFEGALSREPIDGETHYNHGVALQMQRRHEDAARAYQRALAFSPDLVAADFNLGVIFAEAGNRDAAIRAFAHVLERDPAHVMAYRNLGEALFAASRFDEWRANFARFELHCPEALPLAVHGLEVSQWTGDFARVERYLDGLRKERYRAADLRQLADALEELLYLLLFFDIEPELYARVAQTYGRTAQQVYGLPREPDAIRRAGRLRVGYLSADLRNHVMGKMIWQAVSRHDRTHFDVRFYSLSRERDAWTQRFEQVGDAFTDVAGLTDRAAAAALAADDLDILVDLSTHTRGARPGIVAVKPARVAITHVASAGIAGLASVDFRLTDAFCDVAEGPPRESEALLPMAGCVYPYRHVEPADVASLTRETLGIARDAIVLGAFVTGLKLSRRCLALWRDVLARLPQARLAFSPLNAAQMPLYVHLARTAGIARECLVFVPQGADDAANQARYRLVDFVLDPVPYGGVNGTLEALDMGVPVVTLVGARHAERTTYSILANCGVTQTVADSGTRYVDIAVRLATDAAFMREVRAAIRAGLADSALTDMPAHARHLEEAYRTALRLRAPAFFEATQGK
ncbi:MAG: tetratricopeptide repeat protein [Betaproteobacteria bacterium]